MKKAIKILKPVQSYKIGGSYRVSPHFADKLIARGQAEEIKKKEKAAIETKEEKFIPETKVLSISKLRPAVSAMDMDELKAIVEKDSRISARKIAEEEIKKRT